MSCSGMVDSDSGGDAMIVSSGVRDVRHLRRVADLAWLLATAYNPPPENSVQNRKNRWRRSGVGSAVGGEIAAQETGLALGGAACHNGQTGCTPQTGAPVGAAG